jgi:hypothetical protein
MRKSTPDFKIHVDSSCLTDGSEVNTDTDMSPERVSSNQTVVHHEPWSEKPEEMETPEHEHEEDGEEHNADRENTPPQIREDDDPEHQAREQQIDRIEAQIQAAARAVVASIKQDHYGGQEDSVLSMRTDESYEPEGTELTYSGTELTYGESNTEVSYEHHEEGEGGDSSSHHDGDIDDDVFSHSDRSNRSSLNSLHEHNPADDSFQKLLTSPAVGEEAASSHEAEAEGEEEPISRIPSGTSYLPTADPDATIRTPSKVLNRPPFRTPSSVRAMQMSSPTPSIFSSPRSTKRHGHLPTVSMLGTPTGHNRTPTRFKIKKEQPLVLLHVTVMPLSWAYSHLMGSAELPMSLHNVKDSWRLLQEKLGDTVLERGILLPHPQDSYEVLEERLLDALELPVRPRANILKCGHYMGPDTPPLSSDSEGERSADHWEKGLESKWCDICRRDVALENQDVGTERKFRIKTYASNGLMRAGAWAAAWREMERVDVEIAPYVESHLLTELEIFAAMAKHDTHLNQEETHDDGFVDEEVVPEHVHDHSHDEAHRLAEEEEMMRHIAEEEEKERRRISDEERLREIYGHATPPQTPSPVQQPKTRRSSRQRHAVDSDSLPELLLAAFKVAMRDKKNVAICILSVLVLLLALKPRGGLENAPTQAVVMDNVEAPKIEVLTTTVVREKTATVTERVTLPVVTERVIEIPVPEVVKVAESQIPVVEGEVEVEQTSPEMVHEVEVEQTSPEIVHEVEVEVEEPVETPHNPPRIEASRKRAQKALRPSTDPPSNRGPVEVPVVQVEKAAKRTM